MAEIWYPLKCNCRYPVVPELIQNTWTLKEYAVVLNSYIYWCIALTLINWCHRTRSSWQFLMQVKTYLICDPCASNTICWRLKFPVTAASVSSTILSTTAAGFLSSVLQPYVNTCDSCKHGPSGIFISNDHRDWNPTGVVTKTNSRSSVISIRDDPTVKMFAQELIAHH
jgi:hypothetical protein